jgi:hypothetical protein
MALNAAWLALNQFLDEQLPLAERLRQARESRRQFEEELRRLYRAERARQELRGEGRV